MLKLPEIIILADLLVFPPQSVLIVKTSHIFFSKILNLMVFKHCFRES